MRPESALSRTLRDAFVDAASQFDLVARTEASFSALPHAGRVVVVSIGKCAAKMTAGAVQSGLPLHELIIARPSRSLALEPHVHDELTSRGLAIAAFATGHPIPDAESVRAARYVRSRLTRLTPGDTVIVLLSGGASASVALPRDGLTLDDLADATRILLAHGAPIAAVNAVRGRLDGIKHGGILRFANGARVLTIIAADVLGDDDAVIHAVGSAPSVEMSHQAVDTALLAALPPHIATVAASEPRAIRHAGARPLIIARPADFRAECIHSLHACGLEVTTLDDASESIEVLAKRYAAVFATLPRHTCRVAIGEPTVQLPAHSRAGGRAGRLALLLARSLSHLDHAAFLAAASDGVDGESRHAGAVVDHSTLSQALERDVDIDAHLTAFDDGPAHTALGTAIDLASTGLNLLDVHILARA